MGLNLSLCFSDTSSKEQIEYDTEDTQPQSLNVRYEIINLDIPTLPTHAESERTESPKSVDSNQSVLSVISPTKDRLLCGR